MNPPQDHTKYIVGCVTGLSLASLLLGAFLIWKGFEGGAVLIGAGGNGLTGLIGFLGGRNTRPVPASDIPSTTTREVVETPESTTTKTTSTPVTDLSASISIGKPEVIVANKDPIEVKQTPPTKDA